MSFKKERLALDIYDISYNNIWNHQNIIDIFYDFVKGELKVKRVPHFEFLLDHDKLKTLESYEDKKRHADMIISLYIKRNSEMELKLTHGEQELIHQDYETFLSFVKEKGGVDPIIGEFFFFDLFGKTRRTIVAEILRDTYPRFQKSKEFKIALKPHMNDPKVIQLNLVKFWPYSDVDFQSCVVTPKDFKFMEGLALEDGAWDLVEGQKGESAVYTCDKNFFPKVSRCSKFCMERHEINFTDPFERVAAVFVNSVNLSKMPFLSKFRVIEKISHGEALRRHKDIIDTNKIQTFVTGIVEYKFGYPLTSTRMCPVVIGVNCHMKKDEILFVWKPCPLKEFSEGNTLAYGEKLDHLVDGKKEQIYLMFDYQAVLIRRTNHGTNVIRVNIRDVGGLCDQSSTLLSVSKKTTKLMKTNFQKILDTKDPNFGPNISEPTVSGDPLGSMLLYSIIEKQQDKEKRESKFIE